MHGRSAALEWLEDTAKAELASGRDLYFDSGDALIGSNTVWKNYEPNLAKMASLPCAAMAMGNREFNYQRRILDKRAAQRSFPLLCANLADLRSDDPVEPDVMAKRTLPVIDYGGNLHDSPQWSALVRKRWIPGICLRNSAWSKEFSLVLLAAVPVQYPPGAFWEKIFGFRFFEACEILPRIAEYYALRAARIIVLSHLGIDKDEALAPHLPAGTWILGGHTHTTLAEPLEVGGVFIAQTGAFAHNIGILDYNILEPRLSRYRLQLLNLSSVEG